MGDRSAGRCLEALLLQRRRHDARGLLGAVDQFDPGSHYPPE